MLVKDLPEDIQKRVNELYPVNENLDDIPLSNCFIYRETIEGENIWREVNRGNYEPYYEFHRKLNDKKILSLIEELNTKFEKNEKI